MGTKKVENLSLTGLDLWLNSDPPRSPPRAPLPPDRPRGKGGLSQAQLPYLISGLLNPENARATLLQFVSAHVRDCFMKGKVRRGEARERNAYDGRGRLNAQTIYDRLKARLDD